MPPRTACGSAFVRRTIRFDPGGRLVLRSYSSGREATLRTWMRGFESRRAYAPPHTAVALLL